MIPRSTGLYRGAGATPGRGTRRGAGRGGPRRRGGFSRLAAAAVLIGALLGGAVPLGAASGSTSTPTPTPTPESTVPTITVSPVGAGLVSDGQALSLSLRVQNPGSVLLGAVTAEIELGTAPLDSQTEIDAWIEDAEAPGAFSDVGSAEFGSIAPGAEQGATTSVPADDLAGRGPGVYPVSATYGTLTDRAVVTLLPADADDRSTPLAVVVAVTAGPQTVGLLSADDLALLTSADGRLTRILDAVAGTTSILAIDPAVLASIRVLGTAAPASALDWLERLERLRNERFALQFGDADVSAQVDAGGDSLLTPSTLAYAMSADQQPEATPTPSPEPTPEATPTLPDVESLLEVEGARADVFWPADGAASATVAATLTDWASDTADPLTIVSSDSTPSVPSRASGTTGDARVLVYDAATSGALRDVAAAEEFDRASSLAELSARLWLSTSTATGPQLVTSDRLGALSEFGLAAALDAVDAIPGTRSASLVDLASSTPVGVSLESSVDEHRVDALTTLRGGAGRIADFATVLDEPWQLTAREDTAILQLIGAGWSGDPTWPAALAAHASATAETLDSVSIVPLSTIQLAGYDTPLPVYVDNKLPWAANLVLTAEPDDLRLDVERVTEVVAAPGVNTRVQVPVRARVGSGEVTIELRLFSQSYETIGPPRSADVIVRADWETYGLAAIVVIVGGLLVLGIVRTIVRRRRARRNTTDAESDSDADAEPRA